jgi:hypothetical protein
MPRPQFETHDLNGSVTMHINSINKSHQLSVLLRFTAQFVGTCLAPSPSSLPHFVRSALLLEILQLFMPVFPTKRSRMDHTVRLISVGHKYARSIKIYEPRKKEERGSSSTYICKRCTFGPSGREQAPTPSCLGISKSGCLC